MIKKPILVISLWLLTASFSPVKLDLPQPAGSDYIIVANGPDLNVALLRQEIPYKKLIATDGAADRLHEIDIKPDIILGDFDSIHDLADYAAMDDIQIVHKKNQNYTDLEKAIRYCDKHDGKSIIIYGATGGRLDHNFYNARLLKKYWRANRPIIIRTTSQSLQYIENSTITLKGKAEDYCGVFAFPDNATITSDGLVWEMDNYELKFAERESVCNQLTSNQATIHVKGAALIVAPNPELKNIIDF
jgi:thiamine pyrophosphokinase